MRINSDTMQSANAMFKQLSVNHIQQTQKSNKAEAIDITEFSEEGKAAIKLAKDIGIDLSQEDAEIIDKFMHDAPGTLEEKLAALKTVLQKSMPVDAKVIGDVHTARTESLADHVDKALPNTNRHRRENKTSDADALRKMTHQMDDALADMVKTLTDSKGSVAFNDEAIDENFIDKLINEWMGTLIDMPEMAQMLGSESLKAEAADTALSSATSKTQMFLETTITPKLAAVKNRFDAFKTQTAQALNEIIEHEQPLAPQQKADMLAKLIDKVDNAIMKSEIGMYVDIKSERDLLRQSSKLSNARAAVLSGDLDKAESMVKTVLDNIEKMTFNPTLQKAVAVGNPLNVTPEDLRYKDIVKWANKNIHQFSQAEKSPALLVNYLRKMGINHEAEVFQKVFGQHSQQGTEMPEKDLQNLKSLLLQLGKNGETRDQAQTEKILSHINGQQTQLRVEDKQQPQPLVLNISVHVNTMVSDVKVFIKTQQDNLKADWRNFSMFFVLDTKRFGDIGIKVSSVDTHMRIDIKSDRQDAEPVIMPLSKQLKSYIEEVGFTVTGLKFSKFGNESPNRETVKSPSAKLVQEYRPSEKGFDFQI